MSDRICHRSLLYEILQKQCRESIKLRYRGCGHNCVILTVGSKEWKSDTCQNYLEAKENVAQKVCHDLMLKTEQQIRLLLGLSIRNSLTEVDSIRNSLRLLKIKIRRYTSPDDERTAWKKLVCIYPLIDQIESTLLKYNTVS